MASVEKQRKASKYSTMSIEAKKEMYRTRARERYANMPLEEKKIIRKQVAQHKKQGVCDVCKTNRMYTNLQRHEKTKAHMENLKLSQK